MNSLPRIYWYTFFIGFLFINENFIQWVLAVFVGKYSLVAGFQDAYKYVSVTGYLFFTAFRAIPYAILFFVLKSRMKNKGRNIQGIAWGGLAGILAFISWGSWETLYTLYTDEHTSSTAAIAFLFIPIYAVISGLIGGLLGYGVNNVLSTCTKE